MHNGIGPSSALSIGVAIATYVQAKPTIRINILTARFMVILLTLRSSWEETSRLRNYTEAQPRVYLFLERGRRASSRSRELRLNSKMQRRAKSVARIILCAHLPCDWRLIATLIQALDEG